MQLQAECPNVGATSLIVSWFGDDLRCGQCSLKPKVEQKTYDSKKMKWGGLGAYPGNRRTGGDRSRDGASGLWRHAHGCFGRGSD